MVSALTLQKNLRRSLQERSDPEKAPQMQAYMKSEMPYYGVQAPIQKAICRELFRELEFSNQKEWASAIRKIWDEARFREERYAAMNLCEHRTSRAFQDLGAMPLYEHMIVSGAWWDYVDMIASHMVGGILRAEPKVMKKTMRKWSRDENMWKRRTSIISQLGFSEETDLEHLYACIEPSLGSKEFFLQKAIGWALRQYAWVDPKEIKRYVRVNENRLAPLSKREALKNQKQKK